MAHRFTGLVALSTWLPEKTPVTTLAPTAPVESSEAMQELLDKESKGAEDHLALGVLYEQQGQYDQAIGELQLALEIDATNLEAAQRLAFLLEKLNRDAEASPLWDKIWAMREAQANPKRRRLR